MVNETKFKIGDTVQCISDNWFCKKGVIEKVILSGEVDFWITDTTGVYPKGACQSVCDWELMSFGLEEVPMSDSYNINGVPWKGFSGKNQKVNWVLGGMVEHIDMKKVLKAGDLIKVKIGCSPFYNEGDLGVIIKVQSTDGTDGYLIDFNGYNIGGSNNKSHGWIAAEKVYVWEYEGNKEKPMQKLKVGDVVEIIKDNDQYFHKGDIGVVYDCDNTEGYYVDFNNYGNKDVYDGGKWWVSFPYLKAYEFKVGDIVQITKSVSFHYSNGDKGKIIALDTPAGACPKVDFGWKNGDKGVWHVDTSEMKLIVEPKVAKKTKKVAKKAPKSKDTSFVVGDLVQAIVNTSFYSNGDIGTILSIEGADYKVDFNTSGNKKKGIWWIKKDEMVKAPIKKATKKSSIKVCDVIVITKDEEPYFHVGDKGLVIEVSNGTYYFDGYTADFKGCGNTSVYQSGVWFVKGTKCEKGTLTTKDVIKSLTELVQPIIEPLKLGDLVKTTIEENGVYNTGDIGTILTFHKNGDHIMVDFNSHNNKQVFPNGKWWVLKDKLEKVEGGIMPSLKEPISHTGVTVISKDILSGTYFTGSIGLAYSGLFLKLVDGNHHYIVQINKSENFWTADTLPVNDFKGVKINVVAD